MRPLLILKIYNLTFKIEYLLLNIQYLQLQVHLSNIQLQLILKSQYEDKIFVEDQNMWTNFLCAGFTGTPSITFGLSLRKYDLRMCLNIVNSWPLL